MKKIIINLNDSGQRVDKFLQKAVPKMPKSLLYKSIRLKKIKINSKRCDISTKLAEGDIIELYINDEFFNEKKTSSEFEFLKSKNRVEIIFEDKNIIILNKETGLPIHSDNNVSTDTLVNRIKHYLYDKGEFIPENENSFAPAVCNRLDRNTSGLVIAAKNAQALRDLNEKIKNREIHKKYLCITIAVPPKNEDTIKAYLSKDNSLNMVKINNNYINGYKEIITHYKIIKSIHNLSLVEIELITGRTHQIRAHMAHIKCPILGDEKYGIKNVNKKYSAFYQALCAYCIEFDFQQPCSLSYLNNKKFMLEEKSISFIEKYFNY